MTSKISSEGWRCGSGYMGFLLVVYVSKDPLQEGHTDDGNV